MVSLLSNKSPILVVLNKIDERIKEIDQSAYKKKFSNIVGFYKISCKNGMGIDLLLKDIKDAILNLPHIGVDWPRRWTQIRERLEKDGRDYISITEYMNICRDYDLNDEESLFLSDYLHDLGIILHFQKDLLLKNLVILKPEWGTNAVYNVIDSKEVQEMFGCFTSNELYKIWDKSKYPPERYSELLQLMINFEICFKFDNVDEYLIPELLSPREPEFFWSYRDNLSIPVLKQNDL